MFLHSLPKIILASQASVPIFMVAKLNTVFTKHNIFGVLFDKLIELLKTDKIRKIEFHFSINNINKALISSCLSFKIRDLCMVTPGFLAIM